MKEKIRKTLIALGVMLFVICGVNFLFDFLPGQAVPAASVIALVCIGSGTTIGRPNIK
jgi:hypothetical protein